MSDRAQDVGVTVSKDQMADALVKAMSGRKKASRAPRMMTPRPKVEPIAEPVAEQAHRFTEKPHAVRTEKGQVVGRAYRRLPLFETIAKQPAEKDKPEGPRLILPHQLRALRFYRAAWEGAQSSETRCALDVDSVRGGVPSGMPSVLMSDYRVKACDRAMGAIGDTMRAVALQDMTFSDVAMARFGSRERQRVNLGTGRRKPKIVNEIVPRSGRHREIIRDEFLSALKILSAEVERITAA